MAANLKRWVLAGGAAGAALLATGVAVALAQNKRPQPAAPPPPAQEVHNLATADGRVVADIGTYVTKEGIELPLKGLVARAAPAAGNPKVAPGKVRWHADLAAARTASARSGKPVLVFHLMGRLDDRFC